MSDDAAPLTLGRELARKTWHLLLLIYLAVYLHWGQAAFLRAMLPWTVFVAALEVGRLRVPALRSSLGGVFRFIMRPHEDGRLSGVLYTTVGVLAAGVLYGHRPAAFTAAVLQLAFADAAAALVGVGWGKRRFTLAGRTRSWEGCAAGIAAAWLCGLGAGFGPGAALAGAAVFFAIDVLPPPPDDNFWIPVCSGLAFTLLDGARPAWPW